MTLRRMWDASTPPTKPPAWEAVAGYIGGNTPHLWTAAEWAATTARYRLPIFVRSHDGDPTADASFSVAWLQSHGVPKGSTLALDYETRIDAAYLSSFDRAVVEAGWKVMVYGTRRTVLQNPRPSGGYWTAHWTNEPHLCGEEGVAATPPPAMTTESGREEGGTGGRGDKGRGAPLAPSPFIFISCSDSLISRSPCLLVPISPSRLPVQTRSIKFRPSPTR